MVSRGSRSRIETHSRSCLTAVGVDPESLARPDPRSAPARSDLFPRTEDHAHPERHRITHSRRSGATHLRHLPPPRASASRGHGCSFQNLILRAAVDVELEARPRRSRWVRNRSCESPGEHEPNAHAKGIQTKTSPFPERTLDLVFTRGTGDHVLHGRTPRHRRRGSGPQADLETRITGLAHGDYAGKVTVAIVAFTAFLLATVPVSRTDGTER